MNLEELEIVDISYDGAGVAKSGGKVFFVPKALPGEVVQAAIEKENSKFCVARVESVLQASAQRRAAFCPHFDVCGGCDFQNVDEQFEKELKIGILQKELAKVGFCGRIGFVPSARRKNYRNKLKLEVQSGKLGYFQAGTRQFFEVQTCPIASKKLLMALDTVKAFLQAISQNATLPHFFSRDLFDHLKNVYLKDAENGVGICFLFDEKCKLQFLKNKENLERFIENGGKSDENLKDDKNLGNQENSKNANNFKNGENFQKNSEILRFFDEFFVFFAFGEILESDKTKIFQIGKEEKTKEKIGEEGIGKEGKLGKKEEPKEKSKAKTKEKLFKKFDGMEIETDISAFNQINDDVAEKLYKFVVDSVCGQKVVNAYSGQGLLTAMLAKKAEKVFGIEYQQSAHAAAEKLVQQLSTNGNAQTWQLSAHAAAENNAKKFGANNAKENNARRFDAKRVKNICGKVEEKLPKLLQNENVDAVVLDPAREGCKPAVLRALNESGIEKIVYISCNFATLTRDLKSLLATNSTKNDGKATNEKMAKTNEFAGAYKIHSVQIFDMFPCTANMETVVVLERIL